MSGQYVETMFINFPQNLLIFDEDITSQTLKFPKNQLNRKTFYNL